MSSISHFVARWIHQGLSRQEDSYLFWQEASCNPGMKFPILSTGSQSAPLYWGTEGSIYCHRISLNIVRSKVITLWEWTHDHNIYYSLQITMVTLIKWWNALIKGTCDAPTQRRCFIRLGCHHSENSCHCCSVTQPCLTLCDPTDCSTPGFPVHHQLPCLLKLDQTHVHWVGDAIQPSHPLLSPSLPALNLSQHQAWSFPMSHFFLFFCIRWAKYWSFSFNISNIQGWFPWGFTGLISLHSKGLLGVFSNTTVQKLSALQLSALFIVQLSHSYVTTRKTITLTIQIFAGNVKSLLFNMLSKFVIAFFQGETVLISWLQSPSAVILEPEKMKYLTVSIVSPSIYMKWWDKMPWS